MPKQSAYLRRFIVDSSSRSLRDGIWKCLCQPHGCMARYGWGCSVVGALLFSHIAVLVSAAQRNYVTIDEVGHVAAGISHWQSGSYRMYHVNPPLPRMVAVVPILAASPNTNGIQATDTPRVRSEWPSGNQFALDNAGRYIQLVFLARLAGIAWSVLGGALVFFWARELYGGRGGCLALAVWCFEPNILANGAIVTPDLPSAVAGLAATYVFWHYLRCPSWSRAVLSGLLLGIAQLTKFTMLVLYPVWLALWLAFQFAGYRGAERLGKAQGCRSTRFSDYRFEHGIH